MLDTYATDVVGPWVTVSFPRGGVDENLRVGWYHVLEFVHKGETWGIWFPNYELPFFEKATGLKADEESTDCKELFTSSPEV